MDDYIRDYDEMDLAIVGEENLDPSGVGGSAIESGIRIPEDDCEDAAASCSRPAIDGEKRMVARAVEGDQKSFGILNRKYERICSSIMSCRYGIGCGSLIWDDVFDDAMSRFWESVVDDYVPSETAAFSTYAWRVIRNAVSDARKKHLKRVVGRVPMFREDKEGNAYDACNVLADPYASAQMDWVLVKDERARAEAMLRGFYLSRDEKDRVIMRGHYGIFGGEVRSNAEIARELGISGEAVAKRIKRIERDLKADACLRDAWDMAA